MVTLEYLGDMLMDVYVPVGGHCRSAVEGSLALEVFGNDRSAAEG